MAEGDTPKGGKGLKKRLGPLSVGGWAASLGGAAVLYVLLKRYEASKTAAAGASSSVLTAGGTVPSSETTSTTGNVAPFTNYADWLTAAIAQGTSSSGLDSGQILNGITDWLSGQCVPTSQVYNAIAGLISNTSIGLPPGWGSAVPQLSVCATPAAPAAPAAPSAPAAPAAPAAPSVLAQIDAAAWPTIVKFGQDANATTDFVPIGTVTNGVYTGKAAKSGAPVWAGVLGGYAQGANFSTLPNGTVIYGASALNNQGYYN